MPNNVASKILTAHWNDGVIPVNVVAIASNMGVAVMSDPLDTEHSGHYQPAGLNGAPLITYNPYEPLVRQRFTIAHELGHHALEHGERNRDTPQQFMSGTSDERERAANKFAAELLMPTKAVRAMVEVRRIYNLAQLADMFHVSKSAMAYRLRELGYVLH